MVCPSLITSATGYDASEAMGDLLTTDKTIKPSWTPNKRTMKSRVYDLRPTTTSARIWKTVVTPRIVLAKLSSLRAAVSDVLIFVCKLVYTSERKGEGKRNRALDYEQIRICIEEHI